ncbi:hypothetical protein B296_00033654 [Ensete ventricosum]|uniref:Uncharacterized protein n=1 Tax=Ensete ventricosum TaxID=4639 RepID=A0A426Z9L3_ENSVE|nr:hypothetical protein B296_00033654 [Ensete ventricosum]
MLDVPVRSSGLSFLSARTISSCSGLRPGRQPVCLSSSWRACCPVLGLELKTSVRGTQPSKFGDTRVDSGFQSIGGSGYLAPELLEIKPGRQASQEQNTFSVKLHRQSTRRNNELRVKIRIPFRHLMRTFVVGEDEDSLASCRTHQRTHRPSKQPVKMLRTEVNKEKWDARWHLSSVTPDDVDLEDGHDERRAENATDCHRVDDLVPMLVEPAGDDHKEVLPPATGQRSGHALCKVLLAEVETANVSHPIRLLPEPPKRLHPPPPSADIATVDSDGSGEERERRPRWGQGDKGIEVVPRPTSISPQARRRRRAPEREVWAATKGEEAGGLAATPDWPGRGGGGYGTRRRRPRG